MDLNSPYPPATIGPPSTLQRVANSYDAPLPSTAAPPMMPFARRGGPEFGVPVTMGDRPPPSYALPPHLASPSMPPHPPAYPPPGPVAEFLATLNLSEYYHAFLQEGFDRMSSVMELTEEDLVVLGVKRGHRRTIQRQVATMKGIPASMPLELTKRLSNDGQSEEAPPDRPNIPPVTQTNSNVVIVRGSKAEYVPSQPEGPGKRRYRRHPKPDINAPEKPASAYVTFSNGVRHELKGSKSFAELAKIVGERWKNLEPSHKEALEAAATRAKEQYIAATAAYQHTEEHREYQKYLNEFRDRYGGDDDPPRPVTRVRTPRVATSRAATPATPAHRNGDSGDDTYDDEAEGDAASAGSHEGGGGGGAPNSGRVSKRKRGSIDGPPPTKRTGSGSSTTSSLHQQHSFTGQPSPRGGPTPPGSFGPSTSSLSGAVSSSRSTLEPTTQADSALISPAGPSALPPALIPGSATTQALPPTDYGQ